MRMTYIIVSNIGKKRSGVYQEGLKVLAADIRPRKGVPVPRTRAMKLKDKVENRRRLRGNLPKDNSCTVPSRAYIIFSTSLTCSMYKVTLTEPCGARIVSLDL